MKKTNFSFRVIASVVFILFNVASAVCNDMPGSATNPLENELEQALRKSFFSGDSTLELSEIPIVVNRYIDYSFVSAQRQQEIEARIHRIDSLGRVYSIYDNDQFITSVLSIKCENNIYVIGRRDDPAGIVYLYHTLPTYLGNGSFYNTKVMTIGSIGKRYMPVYNYKDKLYLCPDSIYDLTSSTKCTLYDVLLDSINVYADIPAREIKELIGHSFDPELIPKDNSRLLSVIPLDISESADSVLKMYKINMPIEKVCSDINNCFFILIQYKNKYFLCPNWDYGTWAVIIYNIIGTPSSVIDINDMISIFQTINSLNGYQPIQIDNAIYSPKIYRELKQHKTLSNRCD